MKSFKIINAASVEEAVTGLQQKGAITMAGGTDLLGVMKKNILPEYPGVVVNVNAIPGLDYIKEEEGVLKVGAMTKLVDLAESDVIKEKYTALGLAAKKTASHSLRNMGTIAGNICQYNRCWYMRAPDDYFDCIRKGGSTCYAINGDNRYHSIFGGARVEGGLPCADDCPAGIHIPDYFTKLMDRDMAGAATILLQSNPMPAITGRICPHFCQDSCNRGFVDETVSIRDLERTVGDYILEHADELIKAPEQESGKSVAIIGAGPGGLTAAFYLRQKGHAVTVFDFNNEAGGMLRYSVPSFRLSWDVVRKTADMLRKMGVIFKLGAQVNKDATIADYKKDFDAVFSATGAWGKNRINIPGEEMTLSGLDFLYDFSIGKREKPGAKVVVIGGGDVAVDVAVTARRMGVESVTIACLEAPEDMPTRNDELEQIADEGIELMSGWGPARIVGVDGKLQGIELVECTSVFNAEKRFAPTYNQDNKTILDADCVILAVGQKTLLGFYKGAVEINGNVVAVDKKTQATSIPGVYAAGDIVTGPATVVHAIGGGHRAADAIDAYLSGSATCSCSSNACCSSKGALIDLTNGVVDPAGRVQPKRLEKHIRVKNLTDDDVFTLDDNACHTESKRCLNCGCIAVNCSDVAPALVALNARIVTTRRTIPADGFWAAKAPGSTVLETDELVTEIQIPALPEGARSAFIKFTARETTDFPIVNCAAMVGGGEVRVCLNAVHPVPYRALRAEDVVKGEIITEELAEKAGEAAVSDAIPMKHNAYKVQIAKIMVKRALMACNEISGGSQNG